MVSDAEEYDGVRKMTSRLGEAFIVNESSGRHYSLHCSLETICHPSCNFTSRGVKPLQLLIRVVHCTHIYQQMPNTYAIENTLPHGFIQLVIS